MNIIKHRSDAYSGNAIIVFLAGCLIALGLSVDAQAKTTDYEQQMTAIIGHVSVQPGSRLINSDYDLNQVFSIADVTRDDAFAQESARVLLAMSTLAALHPEKDQPKTTDVKPVVFSKTGERSYRNVEIAGMQETRQAAFEGPIYDDAETTYYSATDKAIDFSMPILLTILGGVVLALTTIQPRIKAKLATLNLRCFGQKNAASEPLTEENCRWFGLVDEAETK